MANPLTWIMFLLVFGTAYNDYSWKVTMAIACVFTVVFLVIASHRYSQVTPIGTVAVFAVTASIGLLAHGMARLLCRYVAWRDARINEAPVLRP
jgi:hypothetical protein